MSRSSDTSPFKTFEIIFSFEKLLKSCSAYESSATLQVFTLEWFLMAQHVDRGSLEMCVMHWVFSELPLLYRLCCVFLCHRKKSERGRWSARGEKQVREQPWMRHETHQMTRFFSGTQRWQCISWALSLDPSALVVRSALVIKLYNTDVFCEWVSPSIFWNSFQETEITTISQMMWAAMSSNSFAIVKFATAKLKMKTLSAGFPVALHSTASQFVDRHSNRCFLLLRIADLVVDVADVLDVSVSEIVAFPPSEHLAFIDIVSMQKQILVAVEEAFLGPISIQTKNPMFGVL